MAKKNKGPVNYKTNPAVAFKMGYEAGLKESNIQGFMASNIMQLLAFYNVVGNHIKTERTQANIAKDMEIEMSRLFMEEFQNDIDNIALAIEAVNRIRRTYKMEPIVWDTTPPQAASGAKSEKYRQYLSSSR